MTDFQIYLTLSVFAAVILCIAFDVIDMLLAALLGVVVLVVFGILDASDMAQVEHTTQGPLALLFGGMVVARVLADTGIFERIGSIYLKVARGSGKRFLIGLVVLVAPICALLPNATTVILLAPIIIRVSVAMKIDFTGPMVMVAILSNSAGLLTLVGDPATFLVGSSIGMSFTEYLKKVSLGGLIAVLVIVPMLPLLMKDVWNLQVDWGDDEPVAPLNNVPFAIFSLLVLICMILLFLVGEELPNPIVPPAVAIMGATFALLVVYGFKIAPIDNVLRDVDWKTLAFLLAIFCLVQAITKTGMIQVLSLKLNAWFGTNTFIVAMTMLFGVGVSSSVLANTPVVAASLIAIKGYLVTAELVPETALVAGFTDWPLMAIPIFVAMMFGGTLGGNATLIGGAANIVAAGICAGHGRPIRFALFLKYGLPVTIVQLIVSAGYVFVMFVLIR